MPLLINTIRGNTVYSAAYIVQINTTPQTTGILILKMFTWGSSQTCKWEATLLLGKGKATGKGMECTYDQVFHL